MHTEGKIGDYWLKAVGYSGLTIYLFSVIALTLWNPMQATSECLINETPILYGWIFFFALMALSSLFCYGLLYMISNGPLIPKAAILVGAMLTFNLIASTLLIWIPAKISSNLFSSLDMSSVVVVIFFISVMTTLFTIVYSLLIVVKENELKSKRIAEVERQHLQTQLDLIQAYLNPHFLFNCLNTLGGLIEEDSVRAGKFVNHMSFVLRYMLQNRHNLVVTLQEELSNLQHYLFLIKTRFEGEVNVKIDRNVNGWDFLLGPGTLQILVENAIKHNVHSSKSPQIITIEKSGEKLRVRNNLSPLPKREEKGWDYSNSFGIGHEAINRHSEVMKGNFKKWATDTEYIVELSPIKPNTI